MQKAVFNVSETSVNLYQSIWCYNTEDDHLHLEKKTIHHSFYFPIASQLILQFNVSSRFVPYYISVYQIKRLFEARTQQNIKRFQLQH
jgi:hypothetical protein